MNELNCTPFVPPAPGLEENKITVGRVVQLKCKNESEFEMDGKTANFVLPPEQPYKMKILGFEKNKAEITMDIAFYQAGKQVLNGAIVSDGTQSLTLKSNDLNVESVLKPPADGKPQEPFGPIFPITIGVPWFYWAVLGSGLLGFMTFGVLRVRRILYYRKLRLGLKIYQSPIDPETQFYRSLRLIEKKNYDLVEVERAFRIYNLRVFGLPMFELSNEKILKYFKYSWPECKTERLNLAKLLSDFEELQTKFSDLSDFEKTDFINKLYKYVEQAENNFLKKSNMKAFGSEKS